MGTPVLKGCPSFLISYSCCFSSSEVLSPTVGAWLAQGGTRIQSRKAKIEATIMIPAEEGPPSLNSWAMPGRSDVDLDKRSWSLMTTLVFTCGSDDNDQM